MNTNAPSHLDHSDDGKSSAHAWMVACAMLTLIALFFLLREHWDHVAGKWPYLLLLACPLTHVFMHGQHGHAGRDHTPSTPSPTDPHVCHK